MPDIQTRLEPPASKMSEVLRKYPFQKVWTAIELAGKIGISKAAKDCHIEYRRLVRLVCAYRRLNMSYEEGLRDVFNSAWRLPYAQFISLDRVERIGLKRQNDLIIRVEAAKEAYRMSQRTGHGLAGCLKVCAEQRGLRGKSLVELVREGRIPLHWIR